MRVEAVLLGGFDNAVNYGARFCAFRRVGEQPVPPALNEWLDGPLRAVIVYLWALTPGNGGNAGSPNTIYYTAGPMGETGALSGC